MSTTLNIQVAQSRSAPPGASALGSLFASVLNWVSQRSTKSAAASRRQALADAQEVRTLAYSMAETSPGVAADLLAAVDRHEAALGR